MTEEELNVLKRKAQKWDELGEKIARCYPPEPGDEIEGDETDYIDDADLITIGEMAASAYGWL